MISASVRINKDNKQVRTIATVDFLTNPQEIALEKGESISVYFYVRSSNWVTDTISVTETDLTGQLYYNGYVRSENAFTYQVQVEGFDATKVRDLFCTLSNRVTTPMRFHRGKLFVADNGVKNPVIAYLLAKIVSWLNKYVQVRVLE